MENLNHHILSGIYQLLMSQPLQFLLHHSFIIGIFTGIISVIPFVIKRLPTLIVAIVALLASYYISQLLGFTFMQALYSGKTYFIAILVGNYVIGSIFGCAVANLIQFTRGEHEYATNK